jgi:hypothetical protein
MPGDGPFVLAGGGNLLNNKLYMTLTTSQLHSDNNRDTGVMHVEINPADLSGSFYEIGHDYDRGTTFFSERFTAGTIIRTGAPINLNPSSTASLSLLLD